jgi:hypothetical protein
MFAMLAVAEATSWPRTDTTTEGEWRP